MLSHLKMLYLVGHFLVGQNVTKEGGDSVIVHFYPRA